MKKVAAPKPPPSFQSSNGTREMMTSHHLSDDCAINELLEGRMELDVILPDNRKVRMSVERRTPMMDLLVQATTANKINPGGHVIHMWKGKGHDFVHYKPNTPIGSLDTNTIYIVPKSSVIDPPTKRMSKVIKQPFEQTFRLQVNLPRNQLMVLRVSPKTQLREVKQMACSEKHLDPSKYQLVYPNRPSQILDLSSQLVDYGSTEITLMSISNIEANIYNSATDLIAFTAREEEKKKKGILSIFSKKRSKGSSGGSSGDGSINRVSPCNTLETTVKAGLKKRPAPLPPQAKLNSRIESVSHSRHSSDSSGYHESSVFSDSPETSSGSGLSSLDSTDNHVNGKLSNGITKMVIQTQCVVPKKRKAPPPPVPQTEIQNKEKLKILINDNDNTKENKTSVIDASPEYEEDEVVFSATDTRRTSISSLGTIDDIENSFEQTIAEAQRVIDMEEELKKDLEMKKLEEQTKSVSKSEVVTLHARLEQDLNKQQIHSDISTAFNAVQLQDEVKETIVDDDLKNKEKLNQNDKQSDNKTTLQVLPLQCRKLASSDESSDEVFERCNYVIRKKSRSKTKRKQKLSQQMIENTEEDTKKLENFTIGSYKSIENDLVMCDKILERKTQHASLQRQTERKCITKSESFNVSREEWIKIRPKKCGYGGPGVRICSFLERSDKKKPNDNKVYGLEGSVRGIKGQVRLRCAEITDMGFSPALKEKSRSMLNLIPENNNIEIEIPIDTKEENSNNANLLKRALSEHNLSGTGLSINEECKSEFAKEQERLQQEYRKLQKQFVVWQKQLMSNHTLLEKECLFPKKCVVQESKSKSNNLSQPLIKIRESKSLTRSPKSELLNNVTLSTWNSNRFTDYSTLPNKSSIRQSFSDKKGENIDLNLQDLKTKTKTLTSNGLRSSSNKTYFKPPAVRSSSSTRQRLPPEVRIEDDNQDKDHTINKIENRKERMSRRDSFQKFENLKTITHKQSSDQVFINNRKNGMTNSINIKDVKSNLEISKENEKSINKLPVKESVPTFTYFGGPLNKNHQNDLQNRNYEDSWSRKENSQKLQNNTNTKEQNILHSAITVEPPPPPPPPPFPSLPSKNNKQTSICHTVERKQRPVPNHSVDPRDKLMIEVRNFGGRKGLRKISNPEPAWQLNVFGSQSVTKA